MAEKDEKVEALALEDFKLKPISSAVTLKTRVLIDEDDEDILSINAAPMPAANAETVGDELDLIGGETEAEAIEDAPLTVAVDPIFDELSAPKLPAMPKENRARLQMQSPTKIHFYWSFKENPYKTLSRIFGGQTNYQLVAKLQNLTNDREELFPIDADGAAWFDVDADTSYRVEVGFYAVSRPFVRILFSNTLQTPRRSPSPRQDYSEYFAVSADQFARVLNVSGFQQDAYEIALAGDDIESADQATEAAFSQIFDAEKVEFDLYKSEEMRFVLLALAAGYVLEDLRGQISSGLFAFLQTRREELSATKALAALQANFDIAADEVYEEEESVGETIHGVSLVNFPRSLKRRTLPKFTPPSNEESASSAISLRPKLPKIMPLSSLR